MVAQSTTTPWQPSLPLCSSSARIRSRSTGSASRSSGRLRSALGRPTGQQRGQRGGSRQVRVAVQGQVAAVGDRPVEQLQQLPRPARVDAEVHRGVRQVERAAGPPGYLRPFPRIPPTRPRRKSVGAGMEAAELGHHLAERDQFVGAGVRPGRVAQPAGQPDRTLAQPLGEQPAHPLQLGRRRRTVLPAEHQRAQRAVRYQVTGVDRDAAVQPVQVLPDRAPAPVESLGITVPAGQLAAQLGSVASSTGRVGEAVLAEHLAGDALGDPGGVAGFDE